MHGLFSRHPIIRPLLALALALLTPALSAQQQPKPAGSSIPAPAPPATIVRHANPAKAEEYIKDKKIVVLDVRTPKEYAEGHIAGAKNIDFRAPDFEKQLSTLDRSSHYLVHCASGGRSTQSLEIFKKLQFRSIVHLDGGLKAWQADGKPVVK